MSSTRSQSSEADGFRFVSVDDDRRLAESLRLGDPAAFVSLVERHYASMIRVAMIYVGDRATAEDVIQETWLGVLQGISRFEARSSLRTWIFHILINRARTRGRRDARTVPFSALPDRGADVSEPAVEPERFLDATHPMWPHYWVSYPNPWTSVEEQIMSQEIRAFVDNEVSGLPRQQLEVITLRDIEGWTSREVCSVLRISEANQRVLLHRARSKVRCALERFLSDE
jgi:RNA polymerase sigma-70 factor (ECF subfamily)